MFTSLQSSFQFGEISPDYYGKTDIPEYFAAAKLLRNFFIDRRGNPKKRTGTTYCGPTKNNGSVVRLLDFIVTTTQGVLLELGAKYLRFWINGAPVTSTALIITDISNANPAVVATTTVAPVAGQEVIVSVSPHNPMYKWMNNQRFIVGTVTLSMGTYSFPLKYTDGTDVDSTAWGAFASGSTIMNVILELDTPYEAWELADVKFRQPPGQVMFLVHGAHPPQQLTYFSATNWTFAPINFIPSILSDISVVFGTPGAVGTEKRYYKVTIEDLTSGEESFPMPVGVAQTPQNEKQEFQTDLLFQHPSAGNVQFEFNGQIATISIYDTMAQIQTKMRALSTIGAGNINVTGTQTTIENMLINNNGNFGNQSVKFEFVGALGNQPQNLINIVNWGTGSGQSGILNNVGLLYAQSHFKIVETQHGQPNYVGATKITSIVWNGTLRRIEATVDGAHTLSDGDEVLFYQTGCAQLDNRVFNVVVGSPSIAYIYLDGSAYDLPVSNLGYMQATTLLIEGAAPTLSKPNVLSWALNPSIIGGYWPNNVTYNVYEGVGGVFGFIGTTQANTFNDTGIPADLNFDPPSNPQRFVVANDYPTVIEIFQQRLILGAPYNNNLEFLASRVGRYNNFTNHFNIQADDFIDATLDADHGAKIQNYLSFGLLLTFLDTSENVLSGDATGTITPFAVNNRAQTFNGSASLHPLKINKNVVFLQAQGSLVRDISMAITPYGFTYIESSHELTVLAQHLVMNHSIVDWTYQKLFDSIIHGVRDDGIKIGLTYVKERNVLAWHRHDTQGLYENVCAIPEANESVVYECVNRTVNGNQVRMIERRSTDLWTDIRDANYLDTMSSFDGRAAAQVGGTMTLSGGTNWDTTEELTMTSSNPFFNADMVGDQIWLKGSDGTIIRFDIEVYSSSTVVTGSVERVVPDGVHAFGTDGNLYVNMRNVAIADWSWAVSKVYNLQYLYGSEIKVAVVGDGLVVSNPFTNPTTPLQVASDGTLTLPKPCAVVHVGLAYLSDIDLLDIVDPKGDALIDKKTIVKRSSCMVNLTQGYWVGAQNPDTNPEAPQNKSGPPKTPNYTYGLTEAKVRGDDQEGTPERDIYDAGVPLVTGRILTNFAGEYGYGAGMFIRSIDPIPVNFMAIGTNVEIPGVGK